MASKTKQQSQEEIAKKEPDDHSSLEIFIDLDKIHIIDEFIASVNDETAKDSSSIALLVKKLQDEDDEMARRLILLDTNIKELDLSSTRISKLPSEIGLLTNLAELNLSYTRISKLPVEIFKLTNLIKLDLGSTLIDELPKEIDSFTKLETLCLTSTKIKELPEAFYRLTNLKELELDKVFLSTLSNNLKNLTKLKKLDLSGSFGDLINPASIQTHWFNGELSLEIGMLTNLTELNLSLTNIKELPKEIGSLINLEYLSLHNSCICQVSPRCTIPKAIS